MPFTRVVRFASIAGVLIGALAAMAPADAQTPKRGGVLTMAYEGEPNTYDCHASAGLNVLAFVAPSYSLLLRYDVNAYPKLVGDVAESWTVAPDGLIYTVKLRSNVRFHDGSTLTAEDIKATFDRIRNPPTGIVSIRRADFADVAAIDVIDPQTVAFKLSQPNAALLSQFANGFNCIYSSRRLAESQAFPQTNVMGTGPFQFVEFQKGQSLTAKRFDGYFRPGLPYLDGVKYIVMAPNAPVTAIAGGQIDGLTRVLSPQEIETIRNARGAKVQFISSPTLVLTQVAFNTQRKPFDDIRVRRALSLAFDRKAGIEAMSKITNMISYGAMMRPGFEMAPTADELTKWPGFGPDVAAARAEAKRLLAEAGVPNLSFKLLNRNVANPYISLGVYAIGQWREIGVTAEMNAVDIAPYLATLASGDFDATIDFSAPPSDDPTVVLLKLLPGAQPNYGRYTDATLTDLYQRQKGMFDAVERRKLVIAFQQRVTDQAYVAPMFWAGWTAAFGSDIHGWKNTPSYFTGYDFAEAWRD